MGPGHTVQSVDPNEGEGIVISDSGSEIICIVGVFMFYNYI